MSRCSRLLQTLCCTALVVGAAFPALAATRFLVAVGARTGLAHEDPLIYANSDAERFRNAFVELGSVADGRAIVVSEGGAHALELTIARLAGQVEEAVRLGERVEVLFYVSSHGDAQTLHLDGDTFPLALLEQRLKELPAAATVLVLDACRTHAVASTRDKGAVRGPAFDVTMQREVAPNGFVTLYAARDGEAAQESDMLEGAYFTHHLVVGLRGAADFDRDKRVTLAEAWRHAHQTTLARSHATASAQHPEMVQALEGEAELVLTELSRARATLRLPADVAGMLLLVDAASGRVLLEIKKAGGTALDVAVPATRLRVQLRPDQKRATVRLGEVDLTWGGVTTLDAAALTEEPLLAAAEKGGALVDPTPWFAALTVGAAAASWSTPAWGADVMAGRRLWESPVFARARLGAKRGTTEGAVQNVRWNYTHVDVQGALGAEVEWWLPVVRLAVGADLGLAWLQQQGVRSDEQRLRDGGYNVPRVDTWSVGPRATLDASAVVPIAFGLAAVAQVRAGASVFTVDGRAAPLPDVGGGLGVAYEW